MAKPIFNIRLTDYGVRVSVLSTLHPPTKPRPDAVPSTLLGFRAGSFPCCLLLPHTKPRTSSQRKKRVSAESPTATHRHGASPPTHSACAYRAPCLFFASLLQLPPKTQLTARRTTLATYCRDARADQQEPNYGAGLTLISPVVRFLSVCFSSRRGGGQRLFSPRCVASWVRCNFLPAFPCPLPSGNTQMGIGLRRCAHFG